MKKTIGAGALLVSLLIVLLTALPAAAISEHPLPASSFFAPSFTDDNKMTTQSQDDYPSPTSDFSSTILPRVSPMRTKAPFKLSARSCTKRQRRR